MTEVCPGCNEPLELGVWCACERAKDVEHMRKNRLVRLRQKDPLVGVVIAVSDRFPVILEEMRLNVLKRQAACDHEWSYGGVGYPTEWTKYCPKCARSMPCGEPSGFHKLVIR